jgi:hypothetical protein
MAIPLCSFCQSELKLDAVLCPKCGKDPYANANFRVQDQAFRAGLRRQKTVTVSVDASEAGGRGQPGTQAPVLPPDVTQFYLAPARAGGTLLYQPRLLGFAEVVFVIDKRQGKEHNVAFRLLAEPTAPGHPVAWDQAVPAPTPLEPTAQSQARWSDVPEGLDTGRKLKTLEKAFAEYLYSTQKLGLFENRPLGLISEPAETEEHFRSRCQDAAAVQAQQALDLERVKFGPRFEALDSQLPDEVLQTPSLISRLNPFGSAPTKNLTPRQEEKVRKLTADYQARQAEIREKWKRAGLEVTPIQVKPRKADVRVTHFGIGWVPA